LIRRTTFIRSAAALITLLAVIAPSAADEPKWLYDWQHQLADYLKTVQVSDVEAEPKAIDPAKLPEEHIQRYYYLVSGYSPLLPFMTKAASLPEQTFTWSGLWQPEAELVQPFLKDKHHNLSSGQWWIPTHPNVACVLAWAYSWDESWNPYYDDKAIARRAAIVAISDLLGWTENDYHQNNPTSSKDGRRWGLHPGITGFSLTFNAYTLHKVGNVLPDAARLAWSDGIRHMIARLNTRRPMGPQNMRLSIPVGLYYAYLATGDEQIKSSYQRWYDQTVLSEELSPAAHYWEGVGRAPDGSYNGIAAHRLAELYSITKDEKLLVILRRMYRLKAHLSLPMPDGRWVSPSHYNDRCKSSFANDQYEGRETQLIPMAPEAALFLKKQWRDRKWPDANTIASRAGRPNNRVADAFPWGGGKGQRMRMHDWGLILHLPDFEYHAGMDVINKMLNKNWRLPVLTKERFTENFNNEFHCIRRPGYYAIFYTGAAVASDQGATNQRNMLSGKGGLFNGFAGGGLSALWTPAGVFLIGRMNGHENYQRDQVTLKWGDYLIPGWRDWSNNHVVGLTKDDKILTSARVSWPQSHFDSKANTLTIRGVFPQQTRRQGDVANATIRYERRYQFQEQGFTCHLAITTDQPVELKELYETLPIHLTDDLQIEFLDAAGSTRPDQPTIDAVVQLRLQREQGEVRIGLDRARRISRLGVPVSSVQHGPKITTRNVQIALDTQLTPGEPVTLSYEIQSVATGESLMQVDPAAEPLPVSPPLASFAQRHLLARYHADDAVVDEQGNVIRWPDSSGNGLDLAPLAGTPSPTLALFGESADAGKAVVFTGQNSLSAELPAQLAQIRGISAVALLDCPEPYRDHKAPGNRKHARVVSISSGTGPDHVVGFTLLPRTNQLAKTYTVAAAGYFKNEQPAGYLTLGSGVQLREDALKATGPHLSGKVREVRVYRARLSAQSLILEQRDLR